MSSSKTSVNVLLLEPFYGGSHKVLIDSLQKELSGRSNCTCTTITMKGKKWHWRARTSALYLSSAIPSKNFNVLFSSSVVNLGELLGLRPDLYQSKKILYFHENQMVYPVRQYKDRDFQYGYNQLISCLVADIILFNSSYNMNSFLDSISSFFKVQPDYRPKNIKQQLQPKCKVMYFPVNFSGRFLETNTRKFEPPLHIVWPHRWEHDKRPTEFLKVLYKLKENNFSFLVSLTGEQFTDVHEEFSNAKEILKDNIIHWGRLPYEEYCKVLRTAHVAVSTASHEFFGVAMLEASAYGCYPLCPNILVYPEIYPSANLYKDFSELYFILSSFCTDLSVLSKPVQIDFEKFNQDNLLPQYVNLLIN